MSTLRIHQHYRGWRFGLLNIRGLFWVAAFAFGLSMIAWLFSAMVFLNLSKASDVGAEYRQDLETIVNSENYEQSIRRQVAQDYLQIAEGGQLSLIDLASDTEARRTFIIDQLNYVAETGNELKIYDFSDWSDYYNVWVPVIATIMIAFGSMAALHWYFRESRNRKGEFIADLPWKRAWPYFWLLLTVFPIGWVFYLISFRRLRHYRTMAPVKVIEPDPSHSIYSTSSKEAPYIPGGTVSDYLTEQQRTDATYQILLNGGEAELGDLVEAGDVIDAGYLNPERM